MSQTDAFIEQNKDRFLNELLDLLRIPSVSADPKYKGDVARCAEEVKKRMEEDGLEKVEVCPTKGYPIVYGEKIVDPSKPTVLVYGHYDVQPPDPLDLWHSGPFDPVIKDGMIYGRGAEDMKAEGILQLLALVRLRREGVPLERDVVFLATADEEADFLGALRALSPAGWGERLSRAEYMITEGLLRFLAISDAASSSHSSSNCCARSCGVFRRTHTSVSSSSTYSPSSSQASTSSRDSGL